MSLPRHRIIIGLDYIVDLNMQHSIFCEIITKVLLIKCILVHDYVSESQVP